MNIQIYHPTEGSRTIPAIDFTEAWRRQGWATEPGAPPDNTAPQTPTPIPAEELLYDAATLRTAELESILADEGWDAIKRIADAFDPPIAKADTWGKTIPAIVAREIEEGVL